MILTASTKTDNRQFELFNAESLPEVISLYGERPGCFSLLVKPPFKEARQRSYPVAQLPHILQALDPNIDSYISQAQFFKRNRRVVNLWSVGLCWVDLDTYNTHYGELKPEYAAFAVRMFLQDEGMPSPSMIIHSGRGIYLKWLFEKGIPRAALPRWNAVQATIVRRLQKFGADPNAKDASRVLRLVRTDNKTQPKTRIKTPDSLRPGASQAAGAAPTLRYGPAGDSRPSAAAQGSWYGRKAPFRPVHTARNPPFPS